MEIGTLEEWQVSQCYAVLELRFIPPDTVLQSLTNVTETLFWMFSGESVWGPRVDEEGHCSSLVTPDAGLH